MGDPHPDLMTDAELVDLKELLGRWIQHIEACDVNGNHTLVRASQMTYAFVNATIKHHKGL